MKLFFSFESLKRKQRTKDSSTKKYKMESYSSVERALVLLMNNFPSFQPAFTFFLTSYYFNCEKAIIEKPNGLKCKRKWKPNNVERMK